MFADFDEKIEGFKGLPIGYSCLEFSVFKGPKAPGYLIEGIFEMPSTYGIFLPSFNLDWKERMNRYKNYASAMMVMHDDANGVITVNKRGDAIVKYNLSNKDKKHLRESLKNAARIYFEAGAKRIITSHIKETIIESKNDIDSVLDKAGFDTGDIILISAHPQGGNIMGDKGERSVVDCNLESHEISNLFVTDGSVFPSSIGVNPQFSIMAFATKTAEYLNDDKNKYFK
jgi:Choline dehydrogenase and related flavoproteins